MAQSFKEVAHLKTDSKKLGDNWTHVYDRKNCQCDECGKPKPIEKKYNCMGCLDKGFYELVPEIETGFARRFKECHCQKDNQ